MFTESLLYSLACDFAPSIVLLNYPSQDPTQNASGALTPACGSFPTFNNIMRSHCTSLDPSMSLITHHFNQQFKGFPSTIFDSLSTPHLPSQPLPTHCIALTSTIYIVSRDLHTHALLSSHACVLLCFGSLHDFAKTQTQPVMASRLSAS